MDVKILSSVDASYLAGFIDCEGTVTLSRKHKNENRQLAVTISNTERQILEFTLQAIGAGKITNKRTSKSRHTPSFTYAIYNRQALALLKQIEPYLRSYKVKRTRLILENYIALTPRNGKYTEELMTKRKEFEKAVLETKSI
ncbi:MAG: LAGLIDADG family homing endonuclease [Kangiellaceae bacterium]|nr:LAGLIDADG family homing endonuclease [Kangiellaceae bacterium]